MKGDGKKKIFTIGQHVPPVPLSFCKEVNFRATMPGWSCTMCQCTVLGDEKYCECFISPHSCFSWNIFNPNKKTCIYTKRCPRLSFLPRHTLKGAIEFPTNKQVDPWGFPRGSPQLWWLGYLPSFVRRGLKNSNIYSNYLDEGSWRKKRGGAAVSTSAHTYFISAVLPYRERRIYDE